MSSHTSTTSSHDAVIVGAGVIGLACAWRAAQAGLRVCVLERREPGAGASGVAAGMLAPVTEAEFGAEAVLDLNLEAARAWPAFAEELEQATGLPTGYRACGALHVALDADEAAELRRLHELQLSLGLKAEWLNGRECRELEPGLSTRCLGGIHAPDEAQVDPRALLDALRAAAQGAGAELISGAEVTSPLLEGDRLTGVQTADGHRFATAQTVLAAGAWSGQAEWLPEHARPPIRPVKGQVLRLRTTQATGSLARRLVRTPLVYLVPRDNGEVVVGATTEEQGYDTTVTAGGVHELLREAYRALPDVAELELVEASAGLRPATPDNVPLIGPGAIQGLTLATGHYRNGVLLAPITAEKIAGLLVNAPEPAYAR